MTLVSVNFCGGEVLSIYRQVVILRNFTLIVESNLEKRWFCFTSPCGKPQNSRYPLNQSDAKKPNASPSLAFYRALGSLSSQCLLVMAFSSLIGCCNYFRFCLTLNRNPLWTNSFESFRQQNWFTFSCPSSKKFRQLTLWKKLRHCHLNHGFCLFPSWNERYWIISCFRKTTQTNETSKIVWLCKSTYMCRLWTYSFPLQILLIDWLIFLHLSKASPSIFGQS